MTGAILLLTFGGMMIASALKGVSLAELLSGAGETLKTGAVARTAIDQVNNNLSTGVNTVGDAVINTVGGGVNAVAEGEMSRMASLNTPYLWGGGHSGFTNTGPWDCSGAVSQFLHVAGLLSAPRTSTGLMTWGKAGRGDYFTVYTNPTHVFVYMEAGPHKGMCWGTTRSTGRGGPAWHHHTTIGFIPRHPG